MADMKKFSFNVILVFLLVFAIIGLFWLSALQLEAGVTYFRLLVVGVILVLVTTLYYFASGKQFWFEIPVNKNAPRGVLMLLLGIIVLLGLVFISNASGLGFFSPFVIAPLANFQLTFGAQTFAALSAATSDFWTFFITVFSASVVEELVLGFAFVLIGSLLAFGIRSLLKTKFSDTFNRNWDFWGAMLFSVVFFTVLHTFNGTYLNADGSIKIGFFAFAAGFRFIMNILIYKFGNFGLLFSIGAHMTNNAVVMTLPAGTTPVSIGMERFLQIFVTFPGGILLSLFGILLLIFIVLSIKEIIKEGGLIAKDLVDFE